MEKDKRDWDQVGLGTKSDMALAVELGCHPNTVRLQRMKRKIPAHRDATAKERNWGQLRLGERTDAEIAAELGITSAAVGYHRRRLGMQPANPRSDLDMDALCQKAAPMVDGGQSVAAIAATLNVSEYVVRKIIARIGRPDRHAEFRRKLARFYAVAGQDTARPARTWGDLAKQSNLNTFGVSDADAADAFGVSIHKIRTARLAIARGEVKGDDKGH